MKRKMTTGERLDKLCPSCMASSRWKTLEKRHGVRRVVCRRCGKERTVGGVQ